MTTTLPDLDTPERIAEMVRSFYADVNVDDLIGPIFNDVAGVDWDAHLPKLTAFWCRILLGIEGFDGSPMAKHFAVHQASPLTLAHFERWLGLFERNLDRGWSGPNGERARAFVWGVAQAHAGRLGITK